MSDLLLTALRIGFLLVLWVFILATVRVLRRDLFAPREAKPLTPTRTVHAPNARPTLRSRRGSSRIEVVDGALKGIFVPLGTTPISIGRAADSTIVLGDQAASTTHALLSPRGAQWIVEDLRSSNGTWIDGKRITEPTELKAGSSLRIGETTLELRS